jgi:pimeloyl-ACP methyl ester carboxylesterase
MRHLSVLLLLAGCGPDLPVATSADCVEHGTIDPWKRVAADATAAADKGRVLACEHEATVSADELSGSSPLKGRMAALNGYDLYTIQYVSEGPIGRKRQTSALLYIPSGSGAKGPFPVVAVNHGTNGVGPGCGPSHSTFVVDYMAQPLVARGYAIVAADYFGMGVDDGISPYGVGEGEGYSILDAIRALRRFKTPTFDGAKDLTDELFLYGHSQGGQANLFAHQMWDNAGGFRLLGSITAAPGLGDLRGLDTILGDGTRTVDATMVFMIMILYGHMDYFGAPAASSWLQPAAADYLRADLHDQCWSTVSSTIPSTWPYAYQLFTTGFQSAAKGCKFDGTPCPDFEPWAGYFEKSLPGAFASDVPALLVQGEGDQIVPPYTSACVVDRMKRSGVTSVQGCGYAGADHTGVVAQSMDDALAWMAARRAGRTDSACQAAIAESCR